MKGFLEAIESSWDTPGMKGRFIEFIYPPTRGLPFYCSSLVTTDVQSIKHVDNEIRFRTRNSTYILTVQDA